MAGFIVKHMTRNKTAVLATVLAIALTASSPTLAKTLKPAAFPITLTGDDGVRVTISRPPQRIVSLTPGTTEMLFAIGAGPRVVGDTTSCDYPEAAKRIAKIGGFTPIYEKVVASRPDLVIADSVAVSSAADRLRALHLTVLTIKPLSIAAVEADMKLLGKATGTTAGATAAIGVMESKLRTATSLVHTDPRRPRTLSVVGYNPLWVAGGGTFIDDAIQRAGGVNVAADVHGYAQYSEEQLLARAPEAILAGMADQRQILGKPAFRAVPAVRLRRMISIDSHLIERPGPRLADGVLELARALHPAR